MASSPSLDALAISDIGLTQRGVDELCRAIALREGRRPLRMLDVSFADISRASAVKLACEMGAAAERARALHRSGPPRGQNGSNSRAGPPRVGNSPPRDAFGGKGRAELLDLRGCPKVGPS